MSNWPLDPKLYARLKAIDEPLMDDEEAAIVAAAAKVSETGTILEINPYQGRTTATLALACPGKSQQVYCIDTWEHIYLQIWLDNMTILGTRDIVLPLRGDPMDTLRIMGPHLATKKIELVVLHGRQGLKEMLAVFATCLSFLQPGQTIVVHKTGTAAPYFNQFWEIASKIIHNPNSATALYYGTKP